MKIMPKEIISTTTAPQAIGPYSQAIKIGEQIYCSGQIPLRANGSMVEGSIGEQTEQVLINLRAVLEAAGSSLNDVVKTTIYLVDLGDFAAVNEVYGSYFPQDPPARATVGVTALPKGAKVEIEAVAVVK